MDELQEIFHFFIEGGTANDAFVDVASKCCDELLAYFLVNELSGSRYGDECVNAFCSQQWKYLAFDDFLQNERNDNCHNGLDFFECLDDNFGGWCLGEEMHVTASEELEQEVERESIHVCHWEHGERMVSRVEIEGFVGKVHV